MLIFFDNKGVIYHDCAPEDQTVNVTFYVQILDHCVSVLPL